MGAGVIRATALALLAVLTVAGIVWECLHERERQRAARHAEAPQSITEAYERMAAQIGEQLVLPSPGCWSCSMTPSRACSGWVTYSVKISARGLAIPGGSGKMTP